MKNLPIISLIPRIWLLVVFAIVTNFASLTNLPIIKEHWVHSTAEAWVKTDGVWAHSQDEAWTVVPAKTLFDICGAALYIPGIVSLAILCSVLIVHLFYRQTIDADTHTGRYLREWEELDGRTRVILANVVRIATFLGCCWIAASVGK